MKKETLTVRIDPNELLHDTKVELIPESSYEEDGLDGLEVESESFLEVSDEDDGTAIIDAEDDIEGDELPCIFKYRESNFTDMKNFLNAMPNITDMIKVINTDPNIKQTFDFNRKPIYCRK
jgi:hypothetical protein